MTNFDIGQKTTGSHKSSACCGDNFCGDKCPNIFENTLWVRTDGRTHAHRDNNLVKNPYTETCQKSPRPENDPNSAKYAKMLKICN